MVVDRCAELYDGERREKRQQLGSGSEAPIAGGAAGAGHCPTRPPLASAPFPDAAARKLGSGKTSERSSIGVRRLDLSTEVV